MACSGHSPVCPNDHVTYYYSFECMCCELIWWFRSPGCFVRDMVMYVNESLQEVHCGCTFKYEFTLWAYFGIATL